MKIYASTEFINNNYNNIEEVKEEFGNISTGFDFDQYADEHHYLYTTDDMNDKYLCLSEEDSEFEIITEGE